MGERSKKTGLSRGKQIAVMLSTLVFFALFFGAIAAFLMEPDATFSLKYRGSHTRIPLTREQGLAIMVPLLTLVAAVIGSMYWRGLRHTWRTAQPEAIAPELNPGETVLWFGRPGWRSFRGARLMIAPLVIVVPMLLLWWMWNIVTGTDSLGLTLFRLMFPGFLLFCYVLPLILVESAVLNTWIRDLFGSIAITRGRIVWLTPIKRRIYQTVAADEIVDAVITDSDGKHGSVTVIKRLRDTVEYVYLDGLPEPERALAAVQALITYRSPPGVQP